MAIKFQIIGVALVVTDTSDSDKILLDALKRDVYYNYSELRDNDNVRIYDANGTNLKGLGLINHLLAVCVDADDVAFTESTFLEFARDNLGSNSPSGTGVGLELASVAYTDSIDHDATAGKNTVMITCVNGGEEINGVVRVAGVYTFQPTGKDTVNAITVNANGGKIIIDVL